VAGLATHRVRRASCGALHTIFLTSTNAVLACGCGSKGRLGLGGRANALTPQPVTSLAAHVIVQVSAGTTHSTFVTQAGVVLVCGDDGHGQLGVDGVGRTVLEPMQLPKLEGKRAKVIGASSGGEHTALLLDSVVDEDDVRAEQLHSATAIVQKWIRGNLQRRVKDASKVRRSGRSRKPNVRQREEAAIVIQSAWRMHLQMINFSAKLAKADASVPWENEHGWARARAQFWAAVTAGPFAKAAEKSASMPKSDW